jgi:hypothetical protein
MEIEFADIVGTEASKRTATPQPTYGSDCAASAPGAISVNSGRRSWAASDGVFWGIGESHSSVPPGLYSCDAISSIGPVLKRMANNVDELVDLPDSESERLLQEIVQFRELKQQFQKYGFLYKRGILLWGPPGSGKTVTIQQLLRLFVTEGQGIAIMVSGADLATACLSMVRQIEPERQILAILEDFDALVDNHGESGYLNLLDGESQLQNVVYVATTNYPERLDKRFV